MKTFLTIALTLAGLAATSLPAWAQDVTAGKSLYSSCVACHGAMAEGNQDFSAPRLNHLEPVYIAAQLDKFRQGIRGGEGASLTARQMAPMAATLADDQALADVAAYIASLDSEPSAATIEGDAAMGADYYNQFCGACHGAAGQGNLALNSPPLAGGDDWYLEAQLLAFRAGQRGSHPKDTTGKQMRAMAVILPDEQAVKDVVAFLHSLGR
ncbi:hypothetical protein DWB85_02370 [Seongchinamella sediminis]|uniref:Cytochrome c domain-containing protein n=1 Tax=Seongchinamella sediminis TaxID=2283635 RepID=A0A3L7E0W1_9GAMM|nr:c-type cytochrome [Seongchinamella sediminis]RLQ23418.1 hypothetical protein DWB85_02370 [Seongchinamella sediminis]